MTYRVRMFLLLCACFFPLSVVAGDDPTSAAEAFIALVQANNVSEAVDQLYGSNPWLGKSSDAVTNVKNQLASAPKLVGALKNHEKLQEISVGSRFKYISYLAAYERQPVRFVFEFYKPQDKWMIFSFSFDDKLDDNIEERAQRTVGQ